MRQLIILSTIFLLSNCRPTIHSESKQDWSIVGSWYTDLQDRGEPEDSIANYGEIYVNDSTLYYQEEVMGQGMVQSYFIRNDTIYKCYTSEKGCKFIAMFKIKSFRNDTLWLTLNKEYTKRDTSIFWVRFPKDEKGHYEHSWTKENSDSLGWAVVYDYDRRRHKYYSILGNSLHVYDSALKAGAFKWDMNEEEIQEQIERRIKREQQQNSPQQKL
jgi:hypothetical protein